MTGFCAKFWEIEGRGTCKGLGYVVHWVYYGKKEGDMMGTMTMVIIAILAVKMNEGYLVDICIIYAMISFLAVTKEEKQHDCTTVD